MSTRYTSLFGVFVLLAACAQQGATAPNEQMASQPKSAKCSVLVPDYNALRAGEITRPITVTMNNDGGWCSQNRTTTISGRVTGVPMHVSQQPLHGDVAITVRDNGTHIAYRPHQGFAGTDEFAVNNDMFNIERSYQVVVLK
jgi:hypothetical protein